MPESSLKMLSHSLYAHFLNVKYHTGLAIGTEHADALEKDGFPLPPPPLRYRVHGSINPNSFLRVGRRCASDIESLLEEQGFQFSAFSRILDFGCGCGRVLRFLAQRGVKNGQLYGTDIDAQAINWSQGHLPFAEWRTNPDLPPCKYESGSFDFVFAISVFTHLDEEFQNAWLCEINRILKPNGLLLATLHGEQFLRNVRGQQVGALENKGIVNEVGRTGVLKLDGLPDYYQTTYHSRRYIEEVWGRQFEVLCYKEKGMNKLQDAVLLRKRAAA